MMYCEEDKPFMPMHARFYQKVTVKGPRECWEWKGAIVQNGYGQFSPYTGKVDYAHRVSYQMNYGSIPDGMYVCHECDNKRCVNPNHLWLGTASDNAIDARDKGRLNTKPPPRKLSPEQVAIARDKSLVMTDLARMWGVHEATVHAARHGKNAYAKA